MQEKKSLSLEVVLEVADREGVDPAELTPPLHSVIDTESLDALFESTSSRESASGELAFRYQGYTVHVDSTGSVQVTDSDDSLEADQRLITGSQR